MNLEERLQAASEMAAKEIQILSDPSSKLYPIVKKRVQDILGIQQNEGITNIRQQDTKITKEQDTDLVVKKDVGVEANLGQENHEPNMISDDSKFSRTTQSFMNRYAQNTQSTGTPHVSFSERIEPPRKLKGVLTNRQREKLLQELPPAEYLPMRTSKRDFVVPPKKSLGETRTGLKFETHRYLTEFEKMRVESDQRLRRALQKDAIFKVR